MAVTKNAYTNRTALHCTVDLLREVENVPADLISKLETMAAAADKRAEKAANAPRVKSKEQREREARATEAARIMKEHGAPVTAAWVAENVPGLYSVSGANGCIRTGRNMGLIETVGKEKTHDGKWRTTYRAI